MKKRLYIVGFMFLFINGCANNVLPTYSDQTNTTLSKVYTGNLSSAMDINNNSDDILYNMEYGTIQRLQSNYVSSNLFFTKAQNTIDLWSANWQSSSPSAQSLNAVASVFYESGTDYQPRDYEKVFLSTLHALNHLGLNDFANARIEIKKMYQVEEAIQNYNQATYIQEQTAFQKEKSGTAASLYDQLSVQYDLNNKVSPQIIALKNSYQNAFSHYLSGFVFEALNEPSLSRPGYVKALQLQPNNNLIQQDIKRLDSNIKQNSETTDLLIVQEVGHAPQIKSNEIHAQIPRNFVSYEYASCLVGGVTTLFYPVLENDTNNQELYSFDLDGKTILPLPMVNIDMMAARSLYDNKNKNMAQSVALAIRNIAAVQAKCLSDNANSFALFGGTVVTLGAVDIEKADERNWNMLPSKVNINRVNLPYGVHTFDITINGVKYSKQINLTKPYQILAYRILGNQVYFEPQKDMFNKENN
ncbi:MAG: hypothetical protein PHC75_09160 [Burkholderiales bacterium]|nr:hypothetical protein [Burkholderiales bacterium]